MELIDTHCHLNLNQFNGLVEQTIEAAWNEGIKKILVPGIDIDLSQKAIDLAEKYENVYAAVGIHPTEGLSWNNTSKSTLAKMCQHPKVVAIGEIGLDFYWKDCPQEIQIKVLREQLDIALEYHLPIILHSRESFDTLFTIIDSWIEQSSKQSANGVFHSFEGNLDQAKKVLSIGYKVGIAGPVTYKNAKAKHEIALHLPLEGILLETDSPFLPPHPYRGRQNKPEYVKLVAEKIAQIRELSVKLVAEQTSKNANSVFAWEF